MFTGIVETRAVLRKKEYKGTNCTFSFESPITSELKVDQSVAHNGVCLTIEKTAGNLYEVTAIEETLKKTNLGDLKPEEEVNLERCLKADGRFDGHIVQGHVDLTGTLNTIEDINGSYKLFFSYPEESGHITVEKGSICINGISLTVVDSFSDGFSVAIIPYTWENTNLRNLTPGNRVNLEFDVLGKYMQKILSRK
jgi:riboflavin synthase